MAVRKSAAAANKLEDLEERVQGALQVAFENAQIDGAHHKMWVIDQMVRALLGDEDMYNEFVQRFEYGDEDGNMPEDIDEDTEPEYEWDEGIAP